MAETKHTPGPWTYKWSYLSAGVNDGSHANWQAPETIPEGKCAFCGNPEAEFVKSYSDDKGNFHTHRFPSDDWHTISSSDGTHITGNYDYEEGGICSSEADARLVAASPVGYELAEAVLAQMDDGLDRSAYIQTRAIEFMKIAKGEI